MCVGVKYRRWRGSLPLIVFGRGSMNDRGDIRSPEQRARRALFFKLGVG